MQEGRGGSLLLSTRALCILQFILVLQVTSRDMVKYRLEVSLLESLDHPNVIKLLDVFAVPRTRLVFEHGGQTLHDYAAGTAVPAFIRTTIMAQLVAGVEYLHRSDVIHCGLQPQKVLINASSQIRIIDFRGCCVDRPGMRPVLSPSLVPPDGLHIGALPYRAPELLLGHVLFGPQIEIWALGCIFCELASWRPLFTADGAGRLLEDPFALVGMPMDSSHEELSKFLLWSEMTTL